MAEEIQLDISPMYEGERIRKEDLWVELGGPKADGFELTLAASMDEVQDGKVTIIGPDLKDVKEGSTIPFGMIFKVAGEKIEKDLESIIERRNHALLSYISGLMHLNQRYDIWMRIGKGLAKKGVTSWEQIFKPVVTLYKAEMPFIEKMEVTIVTDPAKVKEELAKAMAVYQARDSRAKGLHDEDVDVFYGCTLCQAFAPTSACVVTPDRPSLCGAITWFDGRAAAKVDPEGPQFPIPKSGCVDAVAGEYGPINEMAEKRSGGEYTVMKLYTFFDAPHTSCGCFETIGFYMPEVDGIGVADRDFKGATPNGLPFSTMAGQTGGGKQVVGFLGMGILYYFSSKFLQADGGWRRIVWMPKKLKERVKEGIPADMMDKIATEDDATDLDSLKKFLLKVDHPVVGGVVRAVDGKKITEGWKFDEVTDEQKEAVIAFIEKTGGDIDTEAVKADLGMSEGQFMQVVEALQADGVLE
ncbi:MAG: Acetyl-CoA decarbonylase/synthase complex subunit beta [Methanosaeta sp. PtaB.Bin039]|nr:MAG: Acetyl-CoA decarbonylase/synthase complex subunit beta [Methanosaeta sp. PtaB.Bin039]HOT08016.1 CO dehydrogenase/CO-methylating acetyl-CoA synthase complex subunit beta [Methanotrichaceae archaeon]HQF17442.1 CO dehydrogenase/CO-methylating acetyl-CoA synthase complex subunit beta [Methanotrichaceae archaeon]HQI92064.1 CO dehydrogenase/CO-methylating acetyl-CoA synthase complex subunit beta [Methanotrichaceae archaeon]HQJ29447.1 CO dehydrogenase/CO-methylating acetyl-CoA synthase complex